MKNKFLIVSFIVISSLLKGQDKPYVIEKYDSGARISSNPALFNDIVYFGNDDSIFCALEASTLKKKWSIKTDSKIRSRPVIHNNMVYFKSGFDVYALDHTTGKQYWVSKVQTNQSPTQQDYWDYHSGAPVIHKGLVYFGFENGAIRGFDIKTGEINVNLQADDSASIKSSLLVKKDVLYFGDWNGKLYAFDLKNKQRLWKYDSYEKQEYPTFGQINTELTVYKDLLFFGARNPEFQAVDTKSGSKKWNFVEKDGGWISGDPLIHNDTLYVAGSDNHKLIAFDPLNGTKFWEFEFLFNNFSQPVIYRDFILFTTGDAYSVYGKSKGFGYLYALNRKDGSIVNFALIGGNLNSTPVLDKDHLFVCSEDGTVYKIAIEGFLRDSDHLSENGYRAFDAAKVDSESNPEAVKIDYKVNYDSPIRIRVTDISDNEIQLIQEGKKESAEHNLLWDKVLNNKEMIKPGYYFLEVSSGDSVMKTFFKIEK